MGALADGIIIGSAVGAIASDRRARRRMAALIFALLAIVFIFCATVIPHAMHWMSTTNASGDDRHLGPLFAVAPFNVIAVIVLIIAGAKWATPAPFSAFAIGKHAIASMRTSVACIVFWALTLVASVLTFLVISNGWALFFMDILVVVLAIITGRLSIGAYTRVQRGGGEVQDGVARALNVSGDTVDVTWVGELRAPQFIATFPRLVPQEALSMLHGNLGHGLPGYQVHELTEARVVLARA
ncbi:MAG: hypothetical protein ACTH31_02495 [Pseudoclavibacter sp.]